MMNMRVDEDNRRAVEMAKARDQKVCQFSRNKFWKNIGCIISYPTFGIGGSWIWEKYEEKKISTNKIKRHSIRVKVDLNEVCVYHILCILFFIIL